jgi:hypothetical protein
MSIGFRPASAHLPLSDAIQAGGKRVTAFATAGDIDAPRTMDGAPLSQGRPRGMFTLDLAPDEIVKRKAPFSIAWNKSPANATDPRRGITHQARDSDGISLAR